MECLHGHHHHHHLHVHAGVAEGLSRRHIRKLILALVIAVVYLVVELLGGYFSGSLALIAESAHKLGDMGSVAMALMAALIARWPANEKKTFGYGRVEILVAMGNALMLMVLSATIFHEALQRALGVWVAHQEHTIAGPLMLAVAVAGLVLNLLAFWVLRPSRKENLNIRGAYLHVVSDLLGSAGTILSGLMVVLFQWHWTDLVISLLIAGIVLLNAIHLLAQSLNILLEASPTPGHPVRIREALLADSAVQSVHDLHFWTITTGKEALLAHVVVAPEAFRQSTIQSLEAMLRERFQLCHITLQLEPAGFEEIQPPF
ncbi:MAG: cation diffusion facilitator family transporter [Candidatus Melainabacteria bacterium]